MARILVVNPNSSIACSDGIAAALAPFRWPNAPVGVLRFEVVTLRDAEGFTAGEVCEILAISPANQRVRLHRGRARIRELLQREVIRP